MLNMKLNIFKSHLILLISWVSLFYSEFQPYVDNGGTVVGITGSDYCIIGSDTRLSEKYFIHSRNYERSVQVRLY